MIEEQAQVVDIIGSRLVLQAQTQSACGRCAASKGCGTSVLAKVIGRKFTRFQAENTIDAAVGDTVVVGISEDALLKGSLMVYVMPIAGMIVFALLADVYFTAALAQRDLFIALAGIFGLVAGAFLAKRYFQRHGNRQKFVPVVLRKSIDYGKL